MRSLVSTHLVEPLKREISFLAFIESEFQCCNHRTCGFVFFQIFFHKFSNMNFFYWCFLAILLVKPILKFEIVTSIFPYCFGSFWKYLYFIIPKSCLLWIGPFWRNLLAHRPQWLIFYMKVSNFLVGYFFILVNKNLCCRIKEREKHWLTLRGPFK